MVLGHKGMLGQMAMKYFKRKGYEIHTIPFRFNAEQRDKFIDELLKYPEAIILNCIGKIKQKTEDDNELLWANALLPLALNQHLLSTQTLVHPSTDCVYDGKTNEPYSQSDQPNAMDTYGWSKLLGEKAVVNRPNTIIFRVSIIGPDESPGGKGLLAWFLGNEAGAELKGFSNHFWNGITTLEWCKQIEKLLQRKDINKKTIFEIGGTKESYSKLQMLELFQSFFNTDFIIKPFEAPEKIDRRMKPTTPSENFGKQLKDLTSFNF